MYYTVYYTMVLEEAGKSIPIGSVACTGDEETLVVEYDIDDPWVMFEAHLHVAVSLEETIEWSKPDSMVFPDDGWHLSQIVRVFVDGAPCDLCNNAERDP